MSFSFPAAAMGWLVSFFLVIDLNYSVVVCCDLVTTWVRSSSSFLCLMPLYLSVHPSYIHLPGIPFQPIKQTSLQSCTHTAHRERERSKWSLLAHWTWPISLSPASRLAWSLGLVRARTWSWRRTIHNCLQQRYIMIFLTTFYLIPDPFYTSLLARDAGLELAEQVSGLLQIICHPTCQLNFINWMDALHSCITWHESTVWNLMTTQLWSYTQVSTCI